MLIYIGLVIKDMTRLQSEDIANVSSQLIAYDDELFAKTGHNLRQIACHAVKLREEDVRGFMPGIRAGIVPIRWGQGVIEGFCEATAEILRHLGFDTFVTGQADIAGLAEAYETKADVVFLSDDNDFVALNAQTRQFVHNAEATAKGFVAGLDLMTGGLVDQPVLVLGCGPVGRSATLSLLECGAAVCLYDINFQRAREIISSLPGSVSGRVTVAPDFHEAMAGHSLVIDATNAAEIIQAEDITARTFIAAPGMPLGLSRDARNKVADRLLHDSLQLGVATMGMAVLKQLANKRL